MLSLHSLPKPSFALEEHLRKATLHPLDYLRCIKDTDDLFARKLPATVEMAQVHNIFKSRVRATRVEGVLLGEAGLLIVNIFSLLPPHLSPRLRRNSQLFRKNGHLGNMDEQYQRCGDVEIDIGGCQEWCYRRDLY
ncbi:hypothetical protein AcV7_005238 [Taiwanofungus camphoratus]|nr:hypothetical protein AcV7_005238 [Antrodia cinnamomea]